MRAKAPRFQPGISRANIAAAKAVIDKLGYWGPLTLSWDDTALEPALNIYQESKDGICVVLGSAAGAIKVTSNGDLDRVFDEARQNKADKASFEIIYSHCHYYLNMHYTDTATSLRCWNSPA